MPQRRSIKNVIVESLVFLGLFASLGHMTVNFWERFMIQSELVHMKTSLQSLKETITHIGAAYDSLHKELRNLIEVAEKKHPTRLKNVKLPVRPAQPALDVPQAVILKLDKTIKTSVQTDPCVAKHDTNTDNKPFPESAEGKKLKAVVKTKSLNKVTKTPPKSVGVGTTNMDASKYERGDNYEVNEPQSEKEDPKTLVNTKSLNAAAENPLKSVGVGNTNEGPIEYERRYKGDIYSVNEPHSCIYSPEYKYCRRRNQYSNPYHNWRV